MTLIESYSDNVIKNTCENFHKLFWTEESMVTEPPKRIEPRTFVKEDFTKGSMTWQLFNEYEKRFK